jgi:hypothetical protein
MREKTEENYLSEKVIGIEYQTFTGFPLYLPGCHAGIRLTTLFASVSSEGSTLDIIEILSTLPVSVIVYLIFTVPEVFLSFASCGYFLTDSMNLTSADSPPGNRGGSS